MSALTDDQPSFRRVRGWSLPKEPAAFLRWLAASGATLEAFLGYPAAEDMPPELRAALTPTGDLPYTPPVDRNLLLYGDNVLQRHIASESVILRRAVRAEGHRAEQGELYRD